MIVKCMRPQNPNFSEEKMGLISAKKSIKTMVPYNGPALVEGSVLVGRTFKEPLLEWFLFFCRRNIIIRHKWLISCCSFSRNFPACAPSICV